MHTDPCTYEKTEVGPSVTNTEGPHQPLPWSRDKVSDYSSFFCILLHYTHTHTHMHEPNHASDMGGILEMMSILHRQPLGTGWAPGVGTGAEAGPQSCGRPVHKVTGWKVPLHLPLGPQLCQLLFSEGLRYPVVTKWGQSLAPWWPDSESSVWSPCYILL